MKLHNHRPSDRQLSLPRSATVCQPESVLQGSVNFKQISNRRDNFMIGNTRRTHVSYLLQAPLITMALTAFFFLSTTSALAQKRVIQKWVSRVDVAQAGGGGATVPVIAADTQKNVYIAGNPNYFSQQPNNAVSQFLEVIKYSSSGAKLWSDLINTPGYSP